MAGYSQRKQIKNTPGDDEPDQETRVMDAQTDALSDLASLGSALADAAGSQRDKEKIKDQILERIGTLDKDTAKALLRDERIQRLLEMISDEKAQNSSDPPGTIKPGWIGNTQVNGFTKKEWTEADLRKETNAAGKPVTFIPVETIQVFWNGLMRQFIADEEITVEKCFKDVYDEHRRAMRIAGEHASYLFKKRDNVSDWSLITAEGARARGLAETGWFVPGGGSVIMAAEQPAAQTEQEEAPERGAA